MPDPLFVFLWTRLCVQDNVGLGDLRHAPLEKRSLVYQKNEGKLTVEKAAATTNVERGKDNRGSKNVPYKPMW